MLLRPDRQSRRHLLAALLLWAIVIGTAGVLLVPTWFKQPKAPPVLPQNETREQIYNLPCNLKGPGDSEAEWNVVRRRQSLVELTHPVRYVIASQAYNIPWGYVSGRPFADRFHCPPRKSTSLQYWIPSLDIPVRDMIYVGTTNRPREEGKPDRGPDESVIHVFRIVGYEEDPENRRHMLEYLVETRHLDARAPGSAAQYGLWHTTVPEGSLQTTYWYKLGDREDAVFECYGVFQRCDGHLNLKDLRIYARLIFDKDAVPQHEVIVEGLRTLLSRWRVQT
jgi:hypothetical protein